VGESRDESCLLFDTIGKQQLYFALPDSEKGNGHEREFPTPESKSKKGRVGCEKVFSSKVECEVPGVEQGLTAVYIDFTLTFHSYLLNAR